MSFLLSLSIGIFTYTVILLLLTKIYGGKLSVDQRLKEVITMNDHISNKNDDLNIPFTERFLKPILYKFINAISLALPIKKETKEKLAEQLKMAGLVVSPQEYMAGVIIFTMGIILVLVMFALSTGKSILATMFCMLIGLYTGFALTKFWLSGKITKRKQKIYHQFPNMLDLLSVSVAAGLGFDQALGYVAEKSEGPLIEELDTTQREIALGKKRKEALQDFSKRCGSQEINTFVVAIIQADELGTSMKGVLDIQSTTIRQAHKQNVEQQAQKLSVKILIPMILFIFPVIFIILLGPAVPSIMQALS